MKIFCACIFICKIFTVIFKIAAKLCSQVFTIGGCKIQSKEGRTKGYSTAMALYSTATIPRDPCDCWHFKPTGSQQETEIYAEKFTANGKIS